MRSEIPAKITLPPKLGFFEPEDFIYMGTLIGLAVYVHWIFLVAGAPAVYKYNRFRAKKARGYTTHKLYEWGVVKLKGYPLGTQRTLKA